MANAPDTSTYLTRNDERTDLPNSLRLVGTPTISVTSIGQGRYQIDSAGNLNAISAIASSGFIRYSATNNTFGSITLTSNSSIAITNPTGINNPQFSVVNDTTYQKVRCAYNGTINSTSSTINFIPGNNVSLSVVPGASSTDVTISASGSGGGGAPTNAGYLITQANSTLTGATNLGSKATGFVLSTVSSSVSTISTVPSSILVSLANSTMAIGSMITGASSTSVATTAPGTSGYVWTSNGSGVQPTWQAASGGALGPTLTSIQALTVASGDTLVGNGTNSMTNVAKGSNGTFLGVASGTVGWNVLPGALPSVGGLSMVRGSLILGGSTATTVSQLSPSSTAGYVLTSAGTGADPVWAAVPGGSLGQPLTSIQGLTLTSQDLLVASTSNTMTNVAKGANGTFLGVASGTVGWSALPGALPSVGALTMVRGSLILGGSTGTTVSQLSPSSTAGFVLTSAGTGADPVWAANAAQPTSALLTSIASNSVVTGDVLVGSGSNAMTRVAIGSSGTGLVSNGTTAAWATLANRSAKFLINTSDSSLPNAQVLSSLSTGLMKVTTTTGAVTTAVAATNSAANDYQAGSRLLSSLVDSNPALLEMWVATGPNSVATIPACTGAGYVLTGSTTVPPGWEPLPGALPSISSLNMVRGSLILGGATSTTVSQLNPSSTAGYVLTSAGTGADPVWAAVPGGSLGATLTSIQGLTVASQDLLVGNGSNSMTNVAKGANGTFLSVAGGSVGWSVLPGIVPNLGQISSVSMGDLLVASGAGNGFNNLNISTNSGYVLTTNGTYPGWAPLQGALPSVGGLSMVRGSLILGGSTATTVSQLSPSSTAGYVLTSAGTGADPVWAAVPGGSLGTTLTSIQGLTIVAGDMLLATGSDTFTNVNMGGAGIMSYTGTPGASAIVNRTITAGTGITVTNGSGASGNPTISVTTNTYQPINANLTALSGSLSSGFVAYTGSNTFAERTLTAGTGVNITNTTGGGNPTFSVVSNTTQQQVGVTKAGAGGGTRQQINFIEGSNVTLTVSDNSGSDRVDVTIAASGGGSGSVTKGTVTFTAGNNPTAVISSSAVASGSVILLAPNDASTFASAAVLPWKVDTYTVGTSAVGQLFGTLASNTTYNWVILN